jgi:hypothetical protein
MNHEHKCRCDACESGDSPGDAKVTREAWEAKMLAEYGWFADIVEDTSETRTGVSLHTHGLSEMVPPHRNLEIVFPLDPKILLPIVAKVVEKIKEGQKFEAGKDYGGFVKGYDIRFVEAEECGRPVLRIILPDKDGNLDRESLTGTFEKQYP